MHKRTHHVSARGRRNGRSKLHTCADKPCLVLCQDRLRQRLASHKSVHAPVSFHITFVNDDSEQQYIPSGTHEVSYEIIVSDDAKHLRETKRNIFWSGDSRHYTQIVILSLPSGKRCLRWPTELRISSPPWNDRKFCYSLPVLQKDRRGRRQDSTFCRTALIAFCPKNIPNDDLHLPTRRAALVIG